MYPEQCNFFDFMVFLELIAQDTCCLLIRVGNICPAQPLHGQQVQQRVNYSLVKDVHALYFLRVGVGLFTPLPAAALGGAGLAAAAAAGAGCPFDSGISMGSLGGMIVLAVKVGFASGIFSP